MPKSRITKKGGVTTHWLEYSKKEIQKLWKKDGQGHSQAMKRDDFCVWTYCNEEDATNLSLWFVHNAFAIPTCTHYNGETLSLYCGDAGGGFYDLKRRVELHVNSYLKKGEVQ